MQCGRDHPVSMTVTFFMPTMFKFSHTIRPALPAPTMAISLDLAAGTLTVFSCLSCTKTTPSNQGIRHRCHWNYPTDITPTLVPGDYEAKPGRTEGHFTDPSLGYEWSEVDCELMDEAIRHRQRTGKSEGAPRKDQGRLASVQSFHGYSAAATTNPALIIVDVGHYLCSQWCILTLRREYV
jgi:hypothetical protein